jgi:hypothetical protein
MESNAWRRGFLGGFAALALAIAGQVAASHAVAGEGTACPSRRAPKRVVLLDRFAQGESRSLTQRVALAVLGAVLFKTCT